MEGLGFYLIMVGWVLLIVFFQREDWRLRKKIGKLEAELNHTKHNQYVRELGFDLDECADIHLPGDCPLCGAK
ncbi:hypothetical protein LCGC14_2153340 [marine sediment metagenome]|uniref:Uncharacterized protein n=1 Tax=marine sediment metagenome TaxID=412755 RepID=A0A0F9DV34_9ZZZZ